MTNPTTQEGEDFETIVGLANPTQPKPQQKPKPEVHPDPTPVKGAYPVDLPRPNAHGKSPQPVNGAYPVDVPNPTAQAKDDKTADGDKKTDGAYRVDDDTD